MELTATEEKVVRRAVEAYRQVRNRVTKGAFQGRTADQILDELHPTPERWAELASVVIGRGEGER